MMVFFIVTMQLEACSLHPKTGEEKNSTQGHLANIISKYGEMKDKFCVHFCKKKSMSIGGYCGCEAINKIMQ